ncbi:MAG: DUF3999 domain-containing protein [Burkholderiales bacterium]
MIRRALLASALAFAPLHLAVAQPVPITLQGSGPYHRLTLPAAIDGRAAFSDLRDVRVRNAAGVVVPWAWLDDDSEAAAAVAISRAAPLFAVASRPAGATSANDEPIGIRLRADGSLALTRSPQTPAPAAGASDWIIDASQIDGALLQARFTIPPGAQGLFAFTLDGSSDLRHWHPIAEEDQLVRLQQAGRSIERLAVELDHVRARFLRLRWRDPVSAPPLTSVTLDSVQAAMPVAAIEWSSPVQASACGADYCDYPALRGLPLQSLRIALAEPNTLAAVQLSSLNPAQPEARHPRNALYALRHGRGQRPAHAGTEQLLADTVVYRLHQPNGEAHSAAIALDGAAHTTLRLRTNAPISTLGGTPPTLSFGSRPRVLVFLAQGQGPFTLGWNAAADQPLPKPGPLAPAQLMPNQRAGQALAADDATVSLAALAPEASAGASAPSAPVGDESHKPWLWAALGAGLLLLAVMAWSLLRGLKTPP